MSIFDKYKRVMEELYSSAVILKGVINNNLLFVVICNEMYVYSKICWLHIKFFRGNQIGVYKAYWNGTLYAAGNIVKGDVSIVDNYLDVILSLVDEQIYLLGSAPRDVEYRKLIL